MPKDAQGYPYTERVYTRADGAEVRLREWEGAYGRPDGYGNNLRTETKTTHPNGLEAFSYEDIHGDEVRWIVRGPEDDGSYRDVYKDASGRWWADSVRPDGSSSRLTIDGLGPSEVPEDTSEYLGEWRDPEEGEEPMAHTSQAQKPPTPEELEAKRLAEAEEEARRDHALDPYRGDEEEARRDHALDPYRGNQNSDLAKQRAEEWARYEEATNPDLAKQRAEELERYEQAQGKQNPPPLAPKDDEGDVSGPGVPYQDYIPFFPMVQDPTTGQWRNAEPGEIAGAEGGVADQPPPAGGPEAGGPPSPAGDTEDPDSQAQEVSPLQFGTTGNFQNAPAEPPVGEQPAPAPPTPYDPANGMAQPDGDGDGTPNEYGDGPDLDGNGVPDEIGINPDSLQPGYPNTPSQGDDGEGIPGLGVPYEDYIPFFPMVQDPTTGQWRNAEPGEIPDAQGGDADQLPYVVNDDGTYTVPTSQAQVQEEETLDPIPSSGQSPFGPPPAAPSGKGDYEEQEVPPLQFGNTGNLQNAPDATLFEEDLFNPEAPGPTLSTDLFDPTTGGPTLDTGLIPDLAQNPHLAKMLNDNLDMAAALERNPGMFDQLKQDSALLAGETSDVTELESFRDASLEPEDVPEPDLVDQDVDAMS